MKEIELKQFVIDSLEDTKGVEIACVDVTRLTEIMDYMIVVSGTSNRHVKAMARNLIDDASKSGIKPLGVEGFEEGEWVLIDLVDVVVHLMLPAAREFYDIENLWDMREPDRDESSVLES